LGREIILEVDRDGNIKSETRGFKADECLSTLKRIFARAGLKVNDSKITRTMDTETAVRNDTKQTV
jgi:hypothetical protein